MTDLKRILHVDDDQNIRDVVDMVLTTLGGYEVLTLSSGAEAIEEAASFKPDLLLLDLAMPGMDGVETLKNLRALPDTKTVPAIFLTAKTEPEDVEKLLATGALAVIEKPIKPMTLCAQLVEIWNRPDTQPNG